MSGSSSVPFVVVFVCETPSDQVSLYRSDDRPD